MAEYFGVTLFCQEFSFYTGQGGHIFAPGCLMAVKTRFISIQGGYSSLFYCSYI